MSPIIGRTTQNLIPDWGTMDEEGVVLLVDKPKGWTSFDVVKRVRSGFRLKKVGHAGTLDPLATGLLILCTGRKTKAVRHFADLEKEYVAEMVLGRTSASFDTETKILSEADASFVTREILENALRHFVGRQLQLPPMYSAVKVAGKPLYKYARKGRTVNREPREIEVFTIELLRFALPLAELHIRCSKGTYVRTLVHDVGQHLGCGALLSRLRRTAIGPYRVEDALTIEELMRLQANQPRQVETEHDRSVTA